MLAEYGPMTLSEIASELGRSLSDVERQLSSFVKDGKVSRDGFGTYSIAAR